MIKANYVHTPTDRECVKLLYADVSKYIRTDRKMNRPGFDDALEYISCKDRMNYLHDSINFWCRILGIDPIDLMIQSVTTRI